jgi:hypothetical protein
MTVLLIVCLFDGFIIQIAALPRTDSVISTTRTAQLATTTMNSELSFRDFMSSKNLKKVSDFLPYLVAQTHFSLQEFTHAGTVDTWVTTPCGGDARCWTYKRFRYPLRGPTPPLVTRPHIH